MALYELDRKGNLNRATHRVPEKEHFDLYRRTLREAPELVDGMAIAITEVVDQRLHMDAPGRYESSTRLGRKILEHWPLRNQWNNLTGGEHSPVSSSLFGQIMWTVMFDREGEGWATTITADGQEEREERAYWKIELGGQ
jgi:hypothetical protein